MQQRSTAFHLTSALAQGALVALLVVGLVAGTAFAAKGGGGKPGGNTGTAPINLVLMDGATEAHFAARVTFSFTTTTTYPFVHLMCYQGGTLVGEGRQGFFPDAIGNPWFYLGPTPSWSGGAANCVANLEESSRRGWSVLGTTSFSVSG